MDLNRKKFSVADAKQLNLVYYLSRLGFDYDPKHSKGRHYAYFSPFREERTPSFKVKKGTNRWRDYGEFDQADRGNIIDFGIKFFKCTVAEFLAQLNNDFSLHQPLTIPMPSARIAGTEDREILIVRERALTSVSLLNYLGQRGISSALAKAWCKEIDYQIKGRVYYAIGFKNNSGGYELRSANYQLSNSPKDLTIIASPKAKTVAVFEGFTDFLSYLSLPGFRAVQPSSYVVLNSLSFFEKARAFLEQYPAIGLYLDQDKSGIRCTQYALSLSPKYRDESGLYKGHKDLNEYLVQLKQQPKPRLRQQL